MLTVDRASYDRLVAELAALQRENERLRAQLDRIYHNAVDYIVRARDIEDAQRACRELG